ncbi:hypothetical protein MMC14_002367 [Varicellaria rhodocarpa]|nr:hypothetical protein [Varicellaria rhodocarpa]
MSHQQTTKSTTKMVAMRRFNEENDGYRQLLVTGTHQNFGKELKGLKRNSNDMR